MRRRGPPLTRIRPRALFQALLRACAVLAEAEPGVFGGEVGASVFDADEGDADPGVDDAVVAGVEGRIGAGIGAGRAGLRAASGCRSRRWSQP